MFFGEYFHSLDSRNRLILPSRFRDCFFLKKDSPKDKLLFMTRSFDTCLALYTELAWKNELSQLRKTSYFQSSSRIFQRLLYSRTIQVCCDRQGRILIPEKFREESGIDRDIAIIGLDQKIEIWDRLRWKNFNEGHQSSFEKLAEALGQTSLVGEENQLL